MPHPFLAQKTLVILKKRWPKKSFPWPSQLVVVIYTPKEAHSRIFVTGGSVIVTNAGHFFFLGEASL